MAGISERVMAAVERSQKNEISEFIIYSKLAGMAKGENRKAIARIANEEKKHYEFWKSVTGKEMQPNSLNVVKSMLIAKIFGITFAIKLMENGEKKAQVNYEEIAKEIPGAKRIEEDEEGHEHILVRMIDEERLKYVSSMVLGLNDALVELSGALAGLTFAIQNSQIIAVTGLITGIAAALSMASSEYLSTKTEEANLKLEKVVKKNPIVAAGYTGAIYLVTVLFLVLPYFALANLYLSLITMLGIVIAIIFMFSYYVSVVQETNFWKSFLRTASVSLGIAAISFGIGVAVRVFLGIQI